MSEFTLVVRWLCTAIHNHCMVVKINTTKTRLALTTVILLQQLSRSTYNSKHGRRSDTINTMLVLSHNTASYVGY